MNFKVIILFLFTIICFAANSQITTTVVTGNWSNSAAWDNGVPVSTGTAVINHTLTIDIKDTVSNLTINATVTAGDTIVVTNLFNINNGVFINSSGILYLKNDAVNKGRFGTTAAGFITGNFIWEKYLERCNGWGMYGGPFDVPLSDYGFLHTGLSDSWPSFWCNTYLYDETIIDTNRNIGWTPPSSISYTVPKTTGVYLFDSSSSATNDPRSIHLIGSIDLSQTIDFNILYTGVANKDYNGWNLISNPYPGTISWDSPSWSSSKINEAIYVLDNCSDSYAVYVGGVGINGGIPFISAGQAFWVKANQPNPSLTCDRNIIVDTLIEIKASSPPVTRISLGSDEMAVRFETFVTDTFDTNYDAYKITGNNDRVYSSIDNINYSIVARKSKSVDTISIFTKGDGILTVTNEISSYIYLKDKLLDSIVLVNSVLQYNFVDDFNFKNRFDLIFSDSPVNTGSSYVKNLVIIKSFDNCTEIELNLPYDHNSFIIVHDMLGMELLRKQVYGSDTIVLNKTGNIVLFSVIYKNNIVSYKIFN